MKELIKKLEKMKLGKPKLPKEHPDYERACEDNDVHNSAIDQAIELIKKG